MPEYPCESVSGRNDKILNEGCTMAPVAYTYKNEDWDHSAFIYNIDISKWRQVPLKNYSLYVCRRYYIALLCSIFYHTIWK